MNTKKTERQPQLWKEMESEDVMLFINFDRQTLRIGKSDDLTPYNGEIAYAQSPHKYKKLDIDRLCDDMNLKYVKFYDGQQAFSVRKPKKKDYKQLLEDYINISAKTYIYLLKKTSAKRCLRAVMQQEYIVLTKIKGIHTTPYTVCDENGDRFTVIFSRKEEMDLYLTGENYKLVAQEGYLPVVSRFKKIFAMDQDAGIYIDPMTAGLCQKKLSIRMKSDFLKKHIND